MPGIFDRMLNDVVRLVKANGHSYENIKARVESKMIFISESTLPIEEGDKIFRELPNGLTETYIVLDRGYYPKFHTMEAHYQVRVQKETAIFPSRNTSPHTIVENLIAGDQINLSNVNQSAITIKSRLENVKQNIGELSVGSEAEKGELQDLISSLSNELKRIPSDKHQEATKLLKRVEVLLEEINASQPDKDRIEITGESLLMAAKNLAAVIPVILPIATQILNVVNKILP